MPKYLVPIDLNQNELQNAVIQNLGTDPLTPATGQIYINTSGTPVLKFWNGTTWITFSNGSGTVTSVTAADTTIDVGGTSSDPTLKVGTGTLTNTHISASAAIDYTKLNLANHIVNADIGTSAAIAYSKLTLTGAIVNADISASAAILYSKLSLGSSIINTDISASAAIAFAKLAAPVANFDFNGQQLTNLGTPSNTTDAATKSYVDTLVQGLSPKGAVVAASIANVSLSSAPSTLDGITLVNGDRVLLKNQTAASGNGIYVFSAAASPFVRSTDMDAWSEVPAAFCWVEKGTTNADTAWVCTADPGGTLGTTAITFSMFATAGVLSATAPLVITSNVITITVAARLSTAGGTLDLASSIVSPGTYTAVLVDTYGRVTAGTDIVSSTGIVAKTAAGTFSARTITGTANQIDVANGTGVSGNPTLSLPAAARTSINATGLYSAVGSGTGTTFTIAQATHGLGSSGNSFCDIIAAVYDITSNATLVYTDVSINTTTGLVTFTFAVSQTLSNYRFTLIGK